MELKELLALLNISEVEVFITTSHPSKIKKIKNGKFTMVKEAGKAQALGLVLTTDDTIEVRTIPDNLIEQVLQERG